MKILKEAYTIPNNVVMFYDRHLRLWTLYIKDEEGNQISNTEYAPSRADAIEMAQDIDNFVIRESLNEAFTDQEIDTVIKVVTNAINSETVKPVPLSKIRDQYVSRKDSLIINNIGDNDIKAILKQNAKHIIITDRNKGVFVQ